MDIMFNRANRRFREPEKLHDSSVLVSPSPTYGIQLRNEIGIIDVQFIRGDADYRAVFLVHFFDAEHVLTALDAIVVEFVPC